jgi:hypothetical protein
MQSDNALMTILNALPKVYMTALAILAITVVATLIIYPLLALFAFLRARKQDTVYFAVTPPSFSHKTPLATEQLTHMLQSLMAARTLKERLLFRHRIATLELVSTRQDGIRYIFGLPRSEAPIFHQQLTAYLPNVTVTEVPDPLAELRGHKQDSDTSDDSSPKQLFVKEFRLARHYAYPLAANETLAQHDPIAYITSAMTRPEPGEQVVYQLVLSAVHPHSAIRIRNTIAVGKDPNLYASGLPTIVRVLFWLIKTPFVILRVLLEAIGDIITPSYDTPKLAAARQARLYQQPAYMQTPATQELFAKFNDKLAQPLFRASIRTVVASNDTSTARQTMMGITSAMASFHVPGFQALYGKRTFPWLHAKFRLFCITNRLHNIFRRQDAILSVAEVAALYHFPYGQTNRTEGVAQSLSSSLPAPLALKQHADAADFDVVLGINKHHGHDTPIGLTESERQRHVYLIGGTGNGKTTLLEYGIIQDIIAGKGVAFIDPHGDSAQKLLGYIPKSRMKDVIYLNPRDLDYPIGLNLLEIPDGLTGTDLKHEKDLIAKAVISVLRKIFDDGSAANAYRIERVLRNAIYTAFTVPDATLFTILRLLADNTYRKQVTRNLKDESLKRFWKEELGKAGEFQRVKMSGGPISRIERFERSESARRMLGQTKSTINFDDIVNTNKILICNFSKGRLGEDTATLFGTTVLAKLQLAAYRRDSIPEAKRVPFYLYVDEFQNFASEHFMALFSEARKYKLFLTMAQQSVAQLKEKDMVTNILDNVGTLIVFRSKSPDTERLVLHQLKPYVEPGQIANLPAYHFYMKVAAVEPQEPLTGETLLPNVKPSESTAKEVTELSRELWGREWVEDEEEPDEVPSPKPVRESKPKVKAKQAVKPKIVAVAKSKLVNDSGLPK